MPVVTLGTLAEKLIAAQTGIDQIQVELRKVNEQALDRRVSKLEDTVKFLSRTVAATLISAIGSAILAVVMSR
jgi:uncharacterized coiled-coil protein SlyX